MGKVSPRPSFVAACALLLSVGALFAGCGDGSDAPGGLGSNPEASKASNQAPFNSALLGEEAATPTPSALGRVNFGKGDCPSTIDPPAIPAKGSTVNAVLLTFCVTVSVEEGSTFTYDAAKWGVYLSEDKQGAYFGPTNVTVFKDDSKLAGTEATRSGQVTLKLTFPDARIPDAFYKGQQGRGKLAFTPFYSPDGKGPDDASSRKIDGLVSPAMQNDVGAIKAPPGVKKVTTTDSAFVVEFEPPASLDSELPADTKQDGASVLSGYLLMYWNHDTCMAEKNWTFGLNPAYDKAAGGKGKTSAVTETCPYPGAPASGGKAPCSFGCSTTPVEKYYKNSFENVLQPKVIPDANGEPVSVGCYTVVRVAASTKSYGVSGLENGAPYGVTVFALDSAGNVGKGRSACTRVVPVDVPLASKEKGARVGSSDCFVVTAAAGDTGALSVHYWRLARDVILARFSAGRSFIEWYAVNGPSVARFVDSHPALKRPLEKIFEWSGKAVMKSYDFFHGGWRVQLDATWKAVRRNVMLLVRSEAEAQEVTETPTPAAEAPAPAPEAPTPTPTPESTPSSLAPDGKTTSDGSSTEGIAHSGIPSGALYLQLGILTPTDDEDLHKAYYAKRRPFTILVGQTFRVLDVGGELGVGAEVRYRGAGGSVPAQTVRSKSPVPAEVVGKRISYYSLGVALAVDYRLRIPAVSWFAPRFNLNAGVQRMREEISNPIDLNSGAGKEDTQLKSRGAEGWSGILGARASLEFSILPLWGGDKGGMRYAYGLEDFAVQFYVGYTKDLSKKMLRLSGLETGVGFAFLFL